MLLVPSSGDTRIVTNYGIVGTDNPGNSVPDGASVDTYGTVTELISAANNNRGDSWLLEVMTINTLNPSALAGAMSLDILIGGATDDVLISSILIGGGFYGGHRSYKFPVHVPGGVRIAARISAETAQTTEPRVAIALTTGNPPPGLRVARKITTYGTKASNSRGLAVTPTASGGTASVTQMTASTSEDHFWFLPGFQVSTDSTIVNATTINVGIGVGASTEERIQTWWFTKNASEVQTGPWPSEGCYRHVPAGTRLTLLTSNGNANDGGHDGHIYAGS